MLLHVRARDSSLSLSAFALRFLLLFGLLTGLWLLIAPLYSAIVFEAANQIFGLERPPIAQVRSASDAFYVNHLNAEGTTPVFRFERYGTFFNVILLAALLLAAPIRSWRERLKRSAIGISLLAAVHIAFVFVYVKAQFVNLGLIAVSSGTAYAYNWLAVLLGALGEGLFPLLIAAGLSGRAWAWALGLRFPLKTRPQVVRRNDPCPCGSGRKYKHCCGRS